ncbi:hypothetical protein LXL04_010392 [Taraxacum kok-saghyz]
MALLVSTWSNGAQSVPQDYVMPPERRPGDFITVCKDIPVIDLQNDRFEIVQQILKACQEFGLFQTIKLTQAPTFIISSFTGDQSDNHGVSEELMADIRALYDEFFNMPIEDKLSVYSETFGRGCKLYTSGLNYAEEYVHYWKDTLKHDCHPLEEHSPSWPDIPAKYREEVGRYVVEVRKMGLKVIDIIGEGLGLTEGYLAKVSQEQSMAVNHYPPCPDPTFLKSKKITPIKPTCKAGEKEQTITYRS